MRRTLYTSLIILLVCSCATPNTAINEPETALRLAPLYRNTLLVSDLDRSLTLYRDALGLNLTKVSDTAADSYSYVFFNLPIGSMKRFAYLDGDGDYKNALGIGEVPSLQKPASGGVRTIAWVQTVADIDNVMEKVKALGLELIPPLEFISRETGTPGIETGVVDFDGHLIMFYGLTKNSVQ